MSLFVDLLWYSLVLIVLTTDKKCEHYTNVYSPYAGKYISTHSMLVIISMCERLAGP